MNKIIITVLILLSIMTTASAGDLGFDDFLPEDPIQEMKDAGVWALVLKIIALIVACIVAAVVIGLLIGVGKTAFHTAGNNSTGRTDAISGMFFIVGAVVVMALLGGIFFSVWNGLT